MTTTANPDLDNLVNAKMEAMLAQISTMMDKKLENVYSELQQIAQTVDPNYTAPIPGPKLKRVTKTELNKDSFWSEELFNELYVTMFHRLEHRDLVYNGMVEVFKMIDPYQKWTAVRIQEEIQDLKESGLPQEEIEKHMSRGSLIGVISFCVNVAGIADKTFKEDRMHYVYEILELMGWEFVDE